MKHPRKQGAVLLDRWGSLSARISHLDGDSRPLSQQILRTLWVTVSETIHFETAGETGTHRR